MTSSGRTLFDQSHPAGTGESSRGARAADPSGAEAASLYPIVCRSVVVSFPSAEISCRSTTKHKWLVLPDFAVTDPFVDVRESNWRGGIGAWDVSTLPAHFRRGRSIGGMNPPSFT